MLPNDRDITDWEFLDLSWREILSCSVFHYRLRRRSSMTGSSWKTGWFDGKKPPLLRWASSLAVSTFLVVNLLAEVPARSQAHPHPHIRHIQDREREMARVAAEVEHSLRAAGVTAIEEKALKARKIFHPSCTKRLQAYQAYQACILGEIHQDKLQDGVPEAIVSVKAWIKVDISVVSMVKSRWWQLKSRWGNDPTWLIFFNWVETTT